MGVVHVEFHISAAGHATERNLKWTEVWEGIAAGAASVPGAVPVHLTSKELAAEKDHISWGLIPDMSPQLGFAANLSAVEQLLAAPGPHLLAVGMGGATEPWWVDDYGSLFDLVHTAGIPVVSHAGERGSAKEVRHDHEEGEREQGMRVARVRE